MGILDLVFPKNCLGCGREGKYTCQNCIDKLLPAKPICPYCKHPSIDGATHINCQKKLGLDGLTSIWNYEGIVRKAILALKYKYATKIGSEISDYLISSLRSLVLPSVQYLTPIPIYWYRQNTRGFNQSVEIGKQVARAFDWRLIPDLLIKSKPTISQVELSGSARKQNLKNVFAVNSNYALNTLHSVLIFDDVFTTGSTMMEAAKVLKRAGVEKVWGLTIAR
jgi:competence protein ComFC